MFASASSFMFAAAQQFGPEEAANQTAGIFDTLQQYLLIISIVVIVLGLLQIVCYWVLFTKAGYPGWAQFIPIYNVLVFLWIAGKPWWWLIVLCIPIIGMPILAINALVSFCRSYGYGVGMALGLIFFPIIFLPVMAFSGSEYVGQRGDA